MVHEGLQRHIISEDGLRGLGSDAAVSSRGVGCRWVELRKQETSLGTAGITDNETRQRKTVGDKILSYVSCVDVRLKAKRLTLASSFGDSSSAAKFS